MRNKIASSLLGREICHLIQHRPVPSMATGRVDCTSFSRHGGLRQLTPSRVGRPSTPAREDGPTCSLHFSRNQGAHSEEDRPQTSQPAPSGASPASTAKRIRRQVLDETRRVPPGLPQMPDDQSRPSSQPSRAEEPAIGQAGQARPHVRARHWDWPRWKLSQSREPKLAPLPLSRPNRRAR